MLNLTNTTTSCNTLLSERLLSHVLALLGLIEQEWRRAVYMPGFHRSRQRVLLRQVHAALGELLEPEL